MDALLTAHPWACSEQKLVLTNPAGLAALPTFHIVCTSTSATREPGLIEDARAGTRNAHAGQGCRGAA